MLTLGITTSTDQVGCALGGHDGIVASFALTLGRRHVETLAPAVEFVMGTAGVTPSDLALVAVDVGPGLFTGLRVGISMARTMAYALAVPMVGVSSLDLLAFPAAVSPRLIAAVVDARRGEVFWALYRAVPGGVQRVSEPAVSAPTDVANDLLARGEEVLAVGDGAVRYADDLTGIHGVEIGDPALAHPSAPALVRLAQARAEREEFDRQEAVQPVYLRRPDAQINWSTRRSDIGDPGAGSGG